ncbi:MAG: hypothetical protein GQ574_27995 [Crocinitomix sp.]|nr:hypothetical protein [Crocinitomix sp.]
MPRGLFTNGKICYEHLRDSVYPAGSMEQQQVIDSIPWIYEQHLIAAPSAFLKLKYAGYLIESKNSNVARIDELLLNVDSLKEQTPARYIGLSFKHLILNHYNTATKPEKIELKKAIFERYFVLIDYANGAIVLNEEESDEQLKSKQLKDYQWSKGFLSKYIVLVVNEPELIEQQMQKQFDQLPTDPVLKLERIAEHLELLEKFNVNNSPVYSQYVYASLALKPSSKGYLGIGNIEMANDQTSKAIKAYVKALELSTTIEEQDDINMRLAQAFYKTKSYRKAFYVAKKVNGTNKGNALVICGNSIVALANNCGESTFARKANFWLANDYYKKAADLGVNVSRSQFLDRAPTNADIFSAGFNIGDDYELKCWGEKTIIR